MAVNDVRMAGNLAVDTTRGPSGLWSDCPWNELLADPSKGMTFFDDFLVIGNADMSSAYKNSLGQWSSYGYAGAQLNDNQTEGGVIRLSSDGDNEGLTLLSSAGAFRFQTANSTTAPVFQAKMWFECRVARSTVTTAKHEFFVGLMAPTLSSGIPAAAQPITTTDDTLMTAGSLFGFHSNGATATRGGPTEVAAAFVKASDTVNYPTNLTTLMASSGNTVLAADTFVKLGFIFDRNAPFAYVTSATARQTAGALRRKIIRFFVNGVELPTFLTTDDMANATSAQLFPLAFMSPVISIMNQTGSTPGYLEADWIRVAQLANS